uniref:Uncharacterized protein n=1 Tax=Anopheles culicifacies TaxID=139723 RepID=A0A182MJQ0_9DIPT
MEKKTSENKSKRDLLLEEAAKEEEINRIIVDMLDSWQIRNTTAEAQRNSPLMTLIEQTPQDAFESMMNDESQPMNPILSMTSDEAQQQTAILSMMNDEEPLQQNPVMPTLKEPPAADLTSSEDDSDEDESVMYVTDFKELYRELKKKLKLLIQRRLLKVTRDRNFLLDRLEKYYPGEVSSSDSDVTVDSDDSVPTELLATTSYTDIDVPGDDVSLEGQITKEELERHLQSRQTMPQALSSGGSLLMGTVVRVEGGLLRMVLDHLHQTALLHYQGRYSQEHIPHLHE